MAFIRLFGLALAAGLLAGASSVQAQSQSPDGMVVIVPGDKQYHQPACPVVAKAGSKVQVARRSEARRRGLTPHECPVGDAPGKAADPNKTKVYTQDGDNKYHRKDCEKLGDNPREITLEEAGRKFWPCPVCEPPIRQRKPKPEGK